MSNPDAIDLDIDFAHENDKPLINNVDNDLDVVTQMGFSSFGGPPKSTYHHKDKGKKRSRSGDAGAHGVATAANMIGLGPRSPDGDINIPSGNSYSSNVVMMEKNEILPPPTEGPDSLSHSHRANQNVLPAKPGFTGIPALGVNDGYTWDTLGHEHGQGDHGHHRGGHGRRGRGRGRGRGDSRGGDIGNGNAAEGYYLPSFGEF